MTRTPRAPAKTFQDLIVWQKAHQFVLAVYRFTESFPKSEAYGLIRLRLILPRASKRGAKPIKRGS